MSLGWCGQTLWIQKMFKLINRVYSKMCIVKKQINRKKIKRRRDDNNQIFILINIFIHQTIILLSNTIYLFYAVI